MEFGCRRKTSKPVIMNVNIRGLGAVNASNGRYTVYACRIHKV